MSRRENNIRKKDGRWEEHYFISDSADGKNYKSVYGHSYKDSRFWDIQMSISP